MLAKRMATILPAADLRRGPGDHQDSQRRRRARLLQRPGGHAALPLAAPHHLRRRADRRRHDSPPRRSLAGPQRRAVSRRAARVPPQRARSHAPAAGRRHRHHRARCHVAQLPGALHAGGRDEPLPLRLLQRPHPRVPLLPDDDPALRREDLRPAARPHRHPHRRAGGELPRAARQLSPGELGRHLASA